MINERYELDRPIGRGSMGVVYRATRLAAPGGVVAIKRVPVASDPMLRERLRAEAEVLALLDHPHIVRVHEVIDDGDGLAVVMPLATGGSLADRLVREGRMDATVVASFAAEIGDALSCAHRQGVLHCDVKPSNILFTSEGDALLTDFGLARWVSRPSVWGGAVMGTAEYLDPEVADGLQPDSRSDVYSLAVVCYEALTGRVPFTGPTALAVLKRAERGRATAVANLVPDLPVGLSEAVAEGMARKRSRRPESAQALAAALRSSGTLAQPRARPCEAGPGTSAPPAAEMGCSSGPPTARFDFRPLGPHDPGEEPRADARARRSPARPALVA
ncbi:MAG TPA: serine/threonine-protein kinase, partial [Acidimicrobiales bacterium]